MNGDCTGSGPPLTFLIQIGLVRETVTVNLDGSDQLTMETLKEIACAFVDRKVRQTHVQLSFAYFVCVRVSISEQSLIH